MKKPLRKIVKSHDKKKKIAPKTVKKVVLCKSANIKPKDRFTPKAQDKTKKVKMVLQHKDHKLTFSTTGNSILGPVNVKPYLPGKNEEYMSKKQLEHFRTVLLQWKSQLMAEVDRTMHHMQNEVSNYPDPVDRASQEEEFSLELRARDRERKLLRKIEETLSRINDNDYGYCDDCGAEVGVRRLEARPTATQCIECKTVAEIREKQVGEIS